MTRYGQTVERAGILERALDMLDYALVIVDEQARVEYRNRAAATLLKGSACPLAVTAGRLAARSKSLQSELRSAIARVCATQRLSALFTADPGRAPLRLVLAPIELGSPGPETRGVAIWIASAQAAFLPDERTLAVLFGLSTAEARLGRGLLIGRTPEECARDAGIGVATVRSQLHSMFAKTGARRQAELVALLSKIPALQFPQLSGA
jgi:DNA-binding CsgD family transcriptional regulator